MTNGSKRRGRLILLFAVAFSVMLGGLAEARAVVYESASRLFWSGTGTYASKTKVTAGDVNGDGKGDVIQLYYKSLTQSSVYVFQSAGTSMAKSYQRYFTMEFSKTQIAAGDYNGDGNCDLYLLHDRGGNTCSVMLMTSDGAMLGAPREIYRTTTGGMAMSRARLTATDVNNDGVDEAVIFYESSAGKAKMYVIGKSYSQIQGRVENAVSGADISGIGVVLYNSSGVVLTSATSGADGSYTLSAPAGSGYHAAFSASDYLPATYWDRYSVYNFSSGGSSSPSSALADSGAQVRIYQGSSLIRTFNVPNQPGTLWKVFEVNGTTITPFNTMSYHTTSSSNVP